MHTSGIKWYRAEWQQQKSEFHNDEQRVKKETQIHSKQQHAHTEIEKAHEGKGKVKWHTVLWAGK